MPGIGSHAQHATRWPDCVRCLPCHQTRGESGPVPDPSNPVRCCCSDISNDGSGFNCSNRTDDGLVDGLTDEQSVRLELHWHEREEPRDRTSSKTEEREDIGGSGCDGRRQGEARAAVPHANVCVSPFLPCFLRRLCWSHEACGVPSSS